MIKSPYKMSLKANFNQKIYNERFENLEKRRKLWTVLTEGFFQKYVRKDDTLLDFGAGYCEFINTIKCKKKIAADTDIGFKKYSGKNVQFVQLKKNIIPLKKSSVDVIFISNVFEHLTKSEICKTILECKRILKTNGKMLILQPNIRFCSKDYWMFFDHITPIDDRALEEVFRVSGFTLINKILRFLPYTTKGNLPINMFLVKIYLFFPFLWRFFGKQSFLVFKK